ncbi:unnamed protein product [marine sediment metagenome]|uniref:Uncharacterized protein n=1 Tax=marine sediment metagenome TaxID=412755 RepID=X0WQS0_9ZZZZ
MSEYATIRIASWIKTWSRITMALGYATLLWVAFHFLSGVVSYFTQ